jgi:hypothetical protein
MHPKKEVAWEAVQLVDDAKSQVAKEAAMWFLMDRYCAWERFNHPLLIQKLEKEYKKKK